MESYKFYQNKKCSYFPCHTGADPERFNCLFCYCPLYALGEQCGGRFCYTEAGLKDCSACLIPHEPDNFEMILSRMDAILELAKRKKHTEEKP